MASQSDIAESIADAFDFDDIHSFVDLGGGYGGCAIRLLSKHSSLAAVVADVPSCTAGASRAIRSAGVSARCRFEGTNFLERVPQSTCYLLRFILHNWVDSEARRILGNCVRAMQGEGVVLVIEELLPPEALEGGAGSLLDLQMLVMTGGRLRTASELETLAEDSGTLGKAGRSLG